MLSGKSIKDILGDIDCGVEDLLGCSDNSVSDADIMESLVGVEKLIRKLTTASVNFTTRAMEHSLPSKHQATPANFLAELLRISHYQARTLTRMSEFCGPRRGLTGNSLEPVYSSTAKGMREGLISTEHFVKIHETLNQIPASVSLEEKQQSGMVDSGARPNPTRDLHLHLNAFLLKGLFSFRLRIWGSFRKGSLPI